MINVLTPSSTQCAFEFPEKTVVAMSINEISSEAVVAFPRSLFLPAIHVPQLIVCVLWRSVQLVDIDEIHSLK